MNDLSKSLQLVINWLLIVAITIFIGPSLVLGAVKFWSQLFWVAQHKLI